jgi:RHS repeat-associated protein
LADANAMQFSSMPVHRQSGLSLYPFRGYDPSLQRWLTRDPIGVAGGINLYAFVGNNPISNVDPYGLDWQIGPFVFGQLPTYMNPNGTLGYGTPPSEQAPSDPSTYGAMRGSLIGDPNDNNFNGKTADQVVGDMGKAVVENAALAALGALGPGEAEGAYQAADKALRAAKAAKCVQAAKALPNVAKAVNSNLPHAVEQAVARGVFDSAQVAADALRALSQSITQNGFPTGTLADTAYADRVLVPVGNNGMAVYQVGANGTAKLKTILIAK